jgi:GTP cyclohydrolase I
MKEPKEAKRPRLRAFRSEVRSILKAIGEDPDRQGLEKTPQRVETALRWLTRGYDVSVEDIIGDAVFTEDHEEMILVRDIEIYSLCEHHMLPFWGRAHVAYVPNGRLIGLSKLPRIVEVFARRLQVQERLTDQIADAIMEALEPQGVGVEKQSSRTVTSAVRGIFRSDSKTRSEFLRLVHAGRSLE